MTNFIEEIDLFLEEVNEPFDWKKIFKNDNSVEVEIGFGKGRFLVNIASAYPSINYLGIETSLKMINVTKKKIMKRVGLNNIRLILGDAYIIINKFIKDSSVQAYHIYFPDPWWKRRHQKRKIFKTQFIKEIERTLINGGYLYIATDVYNYFQEIVTSLKYNSSLKLLEGDLETNWPEKKFYITGYEAKSKEKGNPIFSACFRKENL